MVSRTTSVTIGDQHGGGDRLNLHFTAVRQRDFETFAHCKSQVIRTWVVGGRKRSPRRRAHSTGIIACADTILETELLAVSRWEQPMFRSLIRRLGSYRFGVCVLLCLAYEAHAQCTPPPYKEGTIFAETESVLVESISIHSGTSIRADSPVWRLDLGHATQEEATLRSTSFSPTRLRRMGSTGKKLPRWGFRRR